jgi:C-terminal processing protease CtpA/Prc
MFDSGKIAHFIYPAFSYRPSELQKIGDIFRQIREAGAQDVIVDLRGNGGGEPMMGSLIFSHLSAKAAPQFSAGRIKISPEAIQNMTSGLPLANEGALLTVSDPAALAKVFADAFAQAIQVPKQSNPFTGRVWLMVDHGTFSAANIFSEAFREQGIGKIFGYETGEPTKIGGGIVITFTTKRSGIPYRISASENFAGKLDLSVPEHGVMPDIPFDRKVLAPFRDEADPELAYTLDYVRTHR